MRCLKLSLVLAMALGLPLMAVAEDAKTARIAFQIQEQPLGDALTAFARQAGVQILKRDEEVSLAGLTAPAVSGEMSAREALERLLANTGLTYRFVNERTVRVRAASMPDVGADVRLEEGVRVAQAEGASDSVQRGEQQAGSKDPSGEEEAVQLDEIVVTGTHIRGEGPVGSPVTVISREDIANSGYGTLGQVIQSLPQNFGGGASATLSANYNIRGLAEYNSSFGTGINLRGLGNGATLTLINGQRIAPAGQGTFVDVSMIPVSSIERVDILTDGASAIYGADAIGGVVNVITRRDYEGAQSRVRFGGDGRGRDELSISQSLGRGWGSGNITLSFDHTAEDALHSADRSYAAAHVPLSDLLPEQKANSLYMGFTQDVSDRVAFNAQAFAARREFENALLRAADIRFLDTGKTEGLVTSAGVNVALSGDWNLETSGLYSTTQFDQRHQDQQPSGIVTSRIENSYTLQSADLRLSGSLARLPAGSLRAALGAGWRRERYADPGNGDQDEVRRISAAYAELHIPLIGDASAVRGVKRLVASAAARLDDYSEFGNTTNFRYGIDWTIVDGVKIQSTYSTSFRAPYFFQQSTPLFGLLWDVPDPQSMRPDGLTTAILLNGGNPNLVPETARSWTAGLELRPSTISGLSSRIGYFDISYRNQIQELLGTFFLDVLENPAVADFVDRDTSLEALASLLTGMPDGVLSVDPFEFVHDAADLVSRYAVGAIFNGQNQNAAQQDVRGVDADVQYRHQWEASELTLGVGGTYLLEYVLRPSASAPGADFLNTLFNPVDLKLRTSATWSSGRWQFFNAINYVDGYEDPGTSYSTGGRVASWTTVDVQARYATKDGDRFAGSTIALSITNAFDRDPPRINPLPLQLPFDAENANPLGRVVSLSLTKNW